MRKHADERKTIFQFINRTRPYPTRLPSHSHPATGMKPRTKQKIASTFGWLGLAISTLLLCAWVLSAWRYVTYDIAWFVKKDLYYRGVKLEHGRIQISNMVDIRAMSGAYLSTGWRSGPAPNAPNWQLWFELRDISISGIFPGYAQFIPLWPPILLVTPPSILLIRNNRTRSTHCRCGYPREGLPQNTPCPECGRASPITLNQT